MTARSLQGMARVRLGQALAWPLSADRSVRRGSRVRRDFACTFTKHFSTLLAQRLIARPTRDLDFFTAPEHGHVPAARDPPGGRDLPGWELAAQRKGSASVRQ